MSCNRTPYRIRLAKSIDMPLVKKYENQVVSFIGYLKILCNKSRKSESYLFFLKLAVDKLTDVGIVNILDRVTQSSYEYWNRIMDKDEKFFKKDFPSIMLNLGMSPKFNIFPKLLSERSRIHKGELILSNNDINGLWEHLRLFIELSIQYIHIRRMSGNTSHCYLPKLKLDIYIQRISRC
jgi:hypothetical protein